MMRPDNRTLRGIALQPCGHEGRIKNRTVARGWTNVHRLVGTPMVCVSSAPKIPEHLAPYRRASNQMELCYRDGLQIPLGENGRVP